MIMNRAEEQAMKAHGLLKLAKAKKEVGDYKGADLFYQQALALARSHADAFPAIHYRCLKTYGNFLLDSNKPAEAISFFEEAVEVIREKYKDTDSAELTAETLQGLSRAYGLLGKPSEAADVLLEAVKLFGLAGKIDIQVDHLAAAAYLKVKAGESAEARRLMDEALEAARTRGASQEVLAEVLLGDSSVALACNQYKRALGASRESWSICRRLLGDQHPTTIESLQYVSVAHYRNGKVAEAINLMKQVIAARRNAFEDHSEAVIFNLTDLGDMLMEGGKKPVEAVEVLEEALASATGLMGPLHQITCDIRVKLTILYRALGDVASCTRLLEEKVKALEKEGDLLAVAKALQELGEAFMDFDEPAKAVAPFNRTILLFKDCELKEESTENTVIKMTLAIAHTLLAQAYIASGADSRAVSEAHRAIELLTALKAHSREAGNLITGLESLVKGLDTGQDRASAVETMLDKPLNTVCPEAESQDPLTVLGEYLTDAMPPGLDFKPRQFLEFLKYSISLTREEKERIIKSLLNLDFHQVDELYKILKEEYLKFQAMCKGKPKIKEQLAELQSKHDVDWKGLVRHLLPDYAEKRESLDSSPSPGLEGMVSDHMSKHSKISALDKEADALKEKGKLHEAEDLMRRSLTLKRLLYKPGDKIFAEALYDLADLLMDQEIYDPAVPLLKEAAGILFDDERYPLERLYYDILHNWAVAEYKRGNSDETLKLVRKSEQHSSKAFGDDHIFTASEALYAAETVFELEELDEALTYVEKAMAVYRRSQDKHASVPARCKLLAAKVFFERGNVAEARKEFLEYAGFHLTDSHEEDISQPSDYESLLDVYLRDDDEAYNEIVSTWADWEETAFIISTVNTCLERLLIPPVNNEAAQKNADAFAKAMSLMAYTGDSESTSEKMTDGLNLFRNHFGARHPIMVDLFYLAGECAIDYKDIGQAIYYIEEASALEKKINGKETAFGRKLSHLLVLLYQENDRRDDAVLLLNRLLEENMDRESPDEAERSLLLSELGETYQGMGAPAPACVAWEGALEIELKKGNDPARIVNLQKKLTSLYHQRGDNQIAVLHGRDALESCRRLYGDRHRKTADAMRDLANVYLELHHYKECLELLEGSLAVHRRIAPKSFDTLLGIQDLIKFYSVHLTDPSRSKTFLEESLVLCKHLFGERNQYVAGQTSQLGRWYLSNGEVEEAGKWFREALAMRKEVLGDHHPHVIESLRDMADLHRVQSDSKKSLEVMKEALIIIENNPEPDEIEVIDTYYSLALYALSASESTAAKEYIDQAAARTLRHGGGFSKRMGNHYRLNARIMTRLNDNKAALDFYFMACFIFAVHDDASNLWGSYKLLLNSFLLVLPNRATVFYAAIYFYKQAVNTIERIRRGTHGLPGDLRSSFLFEREQMYQELKNSLIIMNRFTESEQVTRVLKRDAYWAVAAGHRDCPVPAGGMTLTDFESNLQNRLETLVKKAQSLLAKFKESKEQGVYNGTDDPELQDVYSRFEQLMSQYVAGCNEGAIELDNLFTDKLKQESPSADESRGAPIPAGCARLRYFTADKMLKIRLVTAGGSIVKEVEIPAVDLAKKVHDFRTSIHGNRSAPLREAEELYRYLLAPVIDDLREAEVKSIEISADGTLQLLPFAALFDGSRWLVEEFAVTRYGGEVSGRKLQEDWRLYAFGASKGSQELPDLPHVPMELKGIVAGISDQENICEVFIDEDFTKESFFAAAAKQPDILHIACHFIFDPAKMNGSYLLLGDGNVLSLGEFIDEGLDFNGIRLVNLSACETALAPGDLNRDSIENLAGIVLEKGAGAVLASLWPVFDESTAMIMTSFYKHLNSGRHLSLAQALQAAQLELIRKGSGRALSSFAFRGLGDATISRHRDFSHPYYWAPFILLGDGR